MSRLLTALIFAFALVFAPAGQVFASAPAADHHGMMTAADHCADQDGQPKAPDQGMDCCVATCAGAVAMVGAISFAPLIQDSEAPCVASDRVHRSVLAKLPTPPPRIA